MDYSDLKTFHMSFQSRRMFSKSLFFRFYISLIVGITSFGQPSAGLISTCSLQRKKVFFLNKLLLTICFFLCFRGKVCSVN